MRIQFCKPRSMTNKVLVLTLFCLLFTAVNSLGSTGINTVDPEKEETKKKTLVTPKKDVDSLHKGIYLKDQVLLFEEPAKTEAKTEVKEEKKKDSGKEEVQSFNFLYYILQSKISDFITY